MLLKATVDEVKFTNSRREHDFSGDQITVVTIETPCYVYRVKQIPPQPVVRKQKIIKLPTAEPVILDNKEYAK